MKLSLHIGITRLIKILSLLKKETYMKSWNGKLKLQDDELVSSYSSDVFNSEIPIRFTGTNDTVHEKQAQLVSLLVANETQWMDKAINSVIKYYKEYYPDYKKGMEWAGADEEFIEKCLPKEMNREKLLNLLTPSEIYINPEEECELGSFGFGLDCEWNPEHGLGVYFDNWEIIEIGGMDVAFGY
jgi:hypothetical protein